MEQENKNFDRSIERMVNEQEVAPPFGAWNRIAAELDAIAPAGEIAPAKALIPQRALTGIIAGVLILGVSVCTAYFVNTSFNHDKTTAVTTTKPTTLTVATPAPAPINTVKTKNVTQPVIAKAKHYNTPITKSKKTASGNSVVLAPQPVLAANLNAEIPCPIQYVSSITNDETAQAYYFPPVDRNTSDKSTSEKATTSNTTKENKKIGDDNDDNDKKVRSGSNEQKIKFRPKKKAKFHYARTNRL